MCQQGWPNLCLKSVAESQRASLQGEGIPVHQMVGLGTFATHAVVAEAAAIVIDPDIPFPQASLVGCGVMTGVGAVINTARVRSGSSVAVFGCGGIGLNCIQGAALAGATKIIAVDVIEGKLQRARLFGAPPTRLMHRRAIRWSVSSSSRVVPVPTTPSRRSDWWRSRLCGAFAAPVDAA